MNTTLEKIMEMYGRVSFERDMLAAENAQLKQQLAELEEKNSEKR